MIKKIANICTRCGSERIVLKTWKEKITTYFGSSTVIHTETTCPNKECQKIVNSNLAAQKEKREKIRKDRETRVAADKLKRAKKKK